MNLSAIVLTKNEESNIANCLESLSFCDEIIVIDDISVDKTVKIASSYGAKVYIKDLTDNFAKQRNYGISKAQGKWILFIDADEIVSKQLQKEILRETKKEVNYVSGYLFKRTDFLWGEKVTHGEIGDIRLLRLAQRGSGKWERRVHEYWHIIGEIRQMNNPILHYPHPTLTEFLKDINERTTLHAIANKEEGKVSNLEKIILSPIGKFLYGYIFRFGFLDGVVGFIIAMVMSLHSFMSWSKLWFLQRK